MPIARAKCPSFRAVLMYRDREQSPRRDAAARSYVTLEPFQSTLLCLPRSALAQLVLAACQRLTAFRRQRRFIRRICSSPQTTLHCIAQMRSEFTKASRVCFIVSCLCSARRWRYEIEGCLYGNLNQLCQHSKLCWQSSVSPERAEAFAAALLLVVLPSRRCKFR